MLKAKSVLAHDLANYPRVIPLKSAIRPVVTEAVTTYVWLRGLPTVSCRKCTESHIYMLIIVKTGTVLFWRPRCSQHWHAHQSPVSCCSCSKRAISSVHTVAESASPPLRAPSVCAWQRRRPFAQLSGQVLPRPLAGAHQAAQHSGRRGASSQRAGAITWNSDFARRLRAICICLCSRPPTNP